MNKIVKGFTLLVIIMMLGCNSEQNSVKRENKPVLYADARLDIKRDAKNLALFLESILETLPKFSQEKKIPEKEKLEYNLNMIKGFLLNAHRDVDNTLKSLDYLNYYLNKYHPNFLSKEKLDHIRTTILMMSRWPTYS